MKALIALLLLALAGPLHGAENVKPVWDENAFPGWYPIGQGEWTVEDGVITGQHTKAQKEYGHLITHAEYGDFTLRLKYKTSTGNSGVYFRTDLGGASGVSGFQAEIDPQKDAGGLYETNGRSWVVQPKPEDMKKWFKPGEWNEMTISAQGAKIVVTVNGQITAEIDDPKGRRKGHLALQLHGGQEVHVAFKDVEILGEPLPGE